MSLMTSKEHISGFIRKAFCNAGAKEYNIWRVEISFVCMR